MEETSMDDFFEGMSDDYQSEDTAEETETDTEVADEMMDAMQEGEDKPVAEEKSEDADEPPAEESPAETPQEDQTYVLRVNHEDKTVTREELMSYAQMGVDYNRVKGQFEQAKNDNAGLQAKIDEMQGVVDIVNELAQASNVPVADLLKSFRKTRYTSLGYSDKEAELAVERDDLTKERDRLRGKETLATQESNSDRAKREVPEFREKYPDVNLTEELVEKLMPDVQSGMSLSDAYRKMQDAEQRARIKQLEEELAAERQNAANRQSSPGSLKDSGKKQARDEYDDFFDAF